MLAVQCRGALGAACSEAAKAAGKPSAETLGQVAEVISQRLVIKRTRENETTATTTQYCTTLPIAVRCTVLRIIIFLSNFIRVNMKVCP